MSFLAKATTAPVSGAEQIFMVVLFCMIPAAIVLHGGIGAFAGEHRRSAARDG